MIENNNGEGTSGLDGLTSGPRRAARPSRRDSHPRCCHEQRRRPGPRCFTNGCSGYVLVMTPLYSSTCLADHRMSRCMWNGLFTPQSTEQPPFSVLIPSPPRGHRPSDLSPVLLSKYSQPLFSPRQQPECKPYLKLAKTLRIYSGRYPGCPGCISANASHCFSIRGEEAATKMTSTACVVLLKPLPLCSPPGPHTVNN